MLLMLWFMVMLLDVVMYFSVLLGCGIDLEIVMVLLNVIEVVFVCVFRLFVVMVVINEKFCRFVVGLDVVLMINDILLLSVVNNVVLVSLMFFW